MTTHLHINLICMIVSVTSIEARCVKPAHTRRRWPKNITVTGKQIFDHERPDAMPVKITTRVGHMNDPRVHKNANGSYSAKGVRGTFSTWVAAFEAMDDQHRRDLKELQNFHK